MFFSLKKIQGAFREVFREEVGKDIEAHPQMIKLRDELESLKSKKRIEEEEIKHMVKIERERNALELEKKTVAIEKDFQKKEMTLQTQYHDKMIGQLKEEQTRLDKVHSEIMERLPNVNMEIYRGDPKEKRALKE